MMTTTLEDLVKDIQCLLQTMWQNGLTTEGNLLLKKSQHDLETLLDALAQEVGEERAEAIRTQIELQVKCGINTTSNEYLDATTALKRLLT